MNVQQARNIAMEYVQCEVRSRNMVRGAYLAGSILGHAPEDELSPASDVDVVLVLDNAQSYPKPGKAMYGQLLVECSLLDTREFMDRASLLTTHYIGYALSHDSILYDPEHILHRAQAAIHAEYFQMPWLTQRIEKMLQLIEARASGLELAAPLPLLANSYMFTLGISVFPALLAAGENLTVRRRYAAARRVLTRFGYADLYERLLALLTNDISAERCRVHLRELEHTFALAAASTGPSRDYPFRRDILAETSAAALNGCRELVESAHPQEAIFWMGATFARCHTILMLDGLEQRQAQFREFLGDIGLKAPQDYAARIERYFALMPEIRESAFEIANRMYLQGGG